MKTIKLLLLSLMILALSCSKDDENPVVEVPTNTIPDIKAQSFNASETISDTDIFGTVKATDEDKDELSYSITANSDNLFEITKVGALSLVSGKALDFETKTSYEITVEVTDGKAKASAKITIKVIDADENMPPVIADQTLSIEENSVLNTVVGTVVATDPDGDILTYTLDNPSGIITAGFEIIDNKIQLKSGTLNYEDNDSYTVTVTTDDGVFTATAEITIAVTDVNDPPTVGSAAFTVAEDINDTFQIGSISTHDEDGDPLTFSLANTPASDNFEISALGIISLKTGKNLDYETNTFHNFDVIVSDGTVSVNRQVTVNVTDVVEAPPVIVSTFAGSGVGGLVNGTGIAAQFNDPSAMAIDGVGNMYVADQSNNVIRKITPAGVVTTFAGSGIRGNLNGPGATAQFNDPVGLVVDGSGNVYVAEQGNHRIRKITPAGVVSTFAGGIAGFTNATGTSAQFRSPAGITLDNAGNIIVADTGNHAIRKITPSGAVTTLAGDGTSGYVDGSVSQTRRLHTPVGIVVNAQGTILIADSRNNVIRALTSSGTLSTFIGGGQVGGFDHPYGLTLDTNNNLYITDWRKHRIIRVSRNTSGVWMPVVYAGTSVSGFANGSGTTAQFNYPWGIVTDASNNVYIGDYQNNRIRKIANLQTP